MQTVPFVTFGFPPGPPIWLALFAGPLGVVLVALVAVLALPALLRWVWNLTVPPVFGGPALTHWQAFRVLVLVAVCGLVLHF